MVKSQVRESEKRFLKKGPWSPQEDQKLIDYIKRYRIWNWNEMAKAADLFRTGKSCRLRWLNYLRPGIRHGNFSQEEDQIIIRLHGELGTRWSTIAARLPGRTDNDIKNYWNSRLKKNLRNNLVPTSSQETQTATIEANLQRSPISEVDLLLPNAPKSSNLDGCKATSMSSTQSSIHEFSSPSPDSCGEIYVNQTTEEKFDLSEKFGKLQCLLEQPFQTEGLGMLEGYGATTDPGFILPTFYGGFTGEESQSSLEQPFAMEGLNMVAAYEASKDPGFLVKTFHSGFADAELQLSLEKPFPMQGLDTVVGYGAATDPGFVLPTFDGSLANEELQSSLEKPFPMHGLDTVVGYGAMTDRGFVVPTVHGSLANEELRSSLKQPLPMKGLGMVEDYPAATDSGFQVQTFHGDSADEELQSSLEQPFSMLGLNTVNDYGSTAPEVMVSTTTRNFSDEELRKLLEEPFPMEGLDVMEGFRTREPGFTVSIPQMAFPDEEIRLCMAELYEVTTDPGYINL